MKKISTLFKKDPNNPALVINEVNPGNEWVLNGKGKATRKFDGTACAIIDGKLYKRYDVKPERQVPPGAIPCQEPDPITGHWPHWVACDESAKEDRYFFEGLRNLIEICDGTYELCGPKVQGNPEQFTEHLLIRHGSIEVSLIGRSFEEIKRYLSDPSVNIEGIVFHHPDGRMCKIKKSNFNIKR